MYRQFKYFLKIIYKSTLKEYKRVISKNYNNLIYNNH